MKKLAQTTIDGQSGVGVIATRPTNQSGEEGSNPLTPHLVRASGVSKAICDKVTDDWHSYIKSTERGARAIDYLIYGVPTASPSPEVGLGMKPLSQRGSGVGSSSREPSRQIVGTIGFAFLGVRLPSHLAKALSMGQPRNQDWYGLMKARRIASCFRYTLMSHVPKNFASQALAISLRLLKKDWLRKYESDLLAVVTFVKPPWTGSCFKAANFSMVGFTSGRPIRHSGSQFKSGILQDDELYTLVYFYGRSNTNRPPPEAEPVRKNKDALMRGGMYFDEMEQTRVIPVERSSDLETAVPKVLVRKKKSWPWKVVQTTKEGKSSTLSYHQSVKEAVSKLERARKNDPSLTYSIAPTKSNKSA